MGQGVISAFSIRHNIRPHPSCMWQGHSSPGWNRLQLGRTPPALHLSSRSVCVFISTRPKYAKARCQKALTLSHFEYRQLTDYDMPFFPQQNLLLFCCSCDWSPELLQSENKLEMLFSAPQILLFEKPMKSLMYVHSPDVSNAGISQTNQSHKNKWKSMTKTFTNHSLSLAL